MTTKKRGGARPGSGRPPRTDGRTLRIVKVPLTDEEFQLVKDLLSTDDRSVVLMRAVERLWQEMKKEREQK